MTRARLREHAPTLLFALACSGVLAYLGLTTFALTDYDDEVAPSMLALMRGDVRGFLELAPAYGGSEILRAPFAMVPHLLWGGGELAVFRAGALPALLGCAALATVVVGRMRGAGRSRLDRAVVLVALTASPIALRALEIGHPEELLGGALCVAGIMIARERPLAASVLIGLAVANKPWALLAVPVLLATVPGRRVIPAAVAAGGTALAVVAPLLLGSGGSYSGVVHAASQTNDLFQPWQVWYLFGDPGRMAHSVSQGVRDLRFAPGWVTELNRPVILTAGAVIALIWWFAQRARTEEDRDPADPLLLLALVLHMRCLLDPWNFEYYGLPALMALAAWEGLSRRRQAPMLTLAFVVCTWESFTHARDGLDPDVLSLVYLGWAVPLAALMAGLLLSRPRMVPADQVPGVGGRFTWGQPKCQRQTAREGGTQSLGAL